MRRPQPITPTHSANETPAATRLADGGATSVFQSATERKDVR